MHGSANLLAEQKHAKDHPVANTAAAVSLAAEAQQRHVIDQIAWSYAGTPTAGNLKIAVAGVDVWSVDIVADGPGFIPFPNGFDCGVNKLVVVTLAAAGAACTGKLNVSYR